MSIINPTFPQTKVFKEWLGVMSQITTGNPTAEVMLNQFNETLTLTRNSSGVYYIESNELFTENKTVVNGQNIENPTTLQLLGNETTNQLGKCQFKRSTTSRIILKVYTSSVSSFFPKEFSDIGEKLTIRIQIYS